jgi:GNAT superfamily N-acetyltransferase
MSELSSILSLETATISSWPAITTALDGLWLARLARGYTKRSNSVQCLDPDDDGDAAGRLQRMVDLFLRNDRDPLFRVTPLAGPGVLAALDAGGWAPFEESRVLAMPLGEYPEPDGVRFYDGADRNWLEAFTGLAGIDRRSAATLALLLDLIAWPQAGVLLRDSGGEPVAAALAVAAGDIGCYHNVVVRTDSRGKGLGRAVMHAALNWTKTAGANRAAIQVVSDNAPALGLYASLGFSEVYRYHYRRP